MSAAAADAADSGGWCIVLGTGAAEEASANFLLHGNLCIQDAGRKASPDAPPGGIPPSPLQPKAPAAPAFQGELREGRMNYGEQGGRGPLQSFTIHFPL